MYVILERCCSKQKEYETVAGTRRAISERCESTRTFITGGVSAELRRVRVAVLRNVLGIQCQNRGRQTAICLFRLLRQEQHGEADVVARRDLHDGDTSRDHGYGSKRKCLYAFVCRFPKRCALHAWRAGVREMDAGFGKIIALGPLPQYLASARLEFCSHQFHRSPCRRDLRR